jgi:hypothetical protein
LSLKAPRNWVKVGVAQQRHSALAAADELAGAAQAQVLPRDLETVGVLEDDLQPRPRGFRQGLA